MYERSPRVPLVRSGLFGYQLFAPLIDSQTRYEPAIMWSQVGVGQANLSILYGKMNDSRSPPQPPAAAWYGPAGPVVERCSAPFWLSMKTRAPCFGSMRAATGSTHAPRASRQRATAWLATTPYW